MEWTLQNMGPLIFNSCSSWNCTHLPAEADDVLPQLFGLSFIALPQRLSQHALLPLRGQRCPELCDMLLRGVAGQAVFGLHPVNESARGTGPLRPADGEHPRWTGCTRGRRHRRELLLEDAETPAGQKLRLAREV